jgi:hypothetical protein
MATKAEIIAEIQDCADTSGDLDLRRALGDPANGDFELRNETVSPGLAYAIPGFLDCLLSGIAPFTSPPGGGEPNTASSAGTGVSLYYTKTVYDLEFNAIKSENSLLTVALDGVTHDIELTVNESLFDHANILNVGSNTHAQIDTYQS